MKHNKLSKKVLELIEDLDISAGLLEVKKEADELCKKVYNSTKVCKLPNWNLI